MATLKESLATDLSKYEPVEVSKNFGLPPMREGQPTKNPFLRCPMPPVTVTPDSLRQYYIGGQVPQFRILTPNNNQSGAGTGGGTTIIGGGGTIVTPAAGSSSTPAAIAATSVSFTTPNLNNGQTYEAILPMSKSFQLLQLAANDTCRVEIYGNGTAQNNDLARALDAPPLPGSQQDLITDVVLDTAPFKWTFQNRVGANSDSPQQSLIYITITNLDVSSTTITITLFYVPLET
jgi:hypothetical protein